MKQDSSKGNKLVNDGIISGRASRRLFVAGVAAAAAAAWIPERARAQGAGGAGPRRSSGRRRGTEVKPIAPLASGAPRRIVIDTDPGVDDAFALLLAMRSPELRIEAITPVAGNVPLALTLPNALRMVEIAGRADIPVAAGADGPLERKLVTATYAHGENGLDGVQFPAPSLKPAPIPAAEMIARVVRAHPGEVTIAAIGPLTNLALAFKSDPALPKLVREIVLMGGSLSGGNITPAAEFNLYVDPEAARIVFEAGVPLTMVGLDVTRRLVMRSDEVAALEAGRNPAAQAAGKIARAGMNRDHRPGPKQGPQLNDPLVIAALLDPAVIRAEPHMVRVETAGELTAGETVGYRRAPARRAAPPLDQPLSESTDLPFVANAAVALEVDRQRFFRLLIGRLTGAA